MLFSAGEKIESNFEEENIEFEINITVFLVTRLEYRYMQLIENNNPDDDPTVDNVCAQLSDEDDSAEEVQFTAPSKAKRIMNVVRKAIGKVTFRMNEKSC